MTLFMVKLLTLTKYKQLALQIVIVKPNYNLTQNPFTFFNKTCSETSFYIKLKFIAPIL